MRNIFLVLICVVIFSCNEGESLSPFEKCDFQTSETRILKDRTGTLHYSKSIQGFPVNEYTYYIMVQGELPLVICNMPESMKLDEDSESAVVFGGRMVVLPETVDALSTYLELHGLRYLNQ